MILKSLLTYPVYTLLTNTLLTAAAQICVYFVDCNLHILKTNFKLYLLNKRTRIISHWTW